MLYKWNYFNLVWYNSPWRSYPSQFHLIVSTFIVILQTCCFGRFLYTLFWWRHYSRVLTMPAIIRDLHSLSVCHLLSVGIHLQVNLGFEKYFQYNHISLGTFEWEEMHENNKAKDDIFRSKEVEGYHCHGTSHQILSLSKV